jgi:hypothetical protein
MGVNNEGETPQNDNNSEYTPQKESEAGFDAKHNQELEDNMTIEDDHPEIKTPADVIQQARISFFGSKEGSDTGDKKIYSSILQDQQKPYDSLFCLSNIGVANPSCDECYLELNVV